MNFIGDQLDPKQFGGLKGNSIFHYMIELIDFILYYQVDFSKAFNRQSQNILITKLSDMGVPGWLLNIVMGFLSDRSMVVRYKGKTTDTKSLPGGGPQGTLLGLLLFLILINKCGIQNKETDIGKRITSKKKKFSSPLFHAKYVDDLTIAQAINLTDTVVPYPNRPLPDPYHGRLGQKLPEEHSELFKQITNIKNYATENEMKLNVKKSKFMLFNPTTSFDFIPECEIDGEEIELMDEMKLLGLTISNDLKWKSNTETMIKKANSRLWIIKRLKNHGASLADLTDVFTKQVRSILEFGVPVWNSSLTLDEVDSIERIQKCFLYIALGYNYRSYENALDKTELDTLELKRKRLSTNFAVKASKHPKHKHWFEEVSQVGVTTRSDKPKYKPPLYRLVRYQKSPIPYLTSLLNSK